MVPTLYGVFFLALLLACSPALDAKFSLPKLNVLAVGVCAFGVLFIVRYWRGRIVVPPRKVLILALALGGWWIVSTPFALHVPTALNGEYNNYNGLWTHLCCLGLFMASMTLPTDTAAVKKILALMVASILLVAALNVLETTGVTTIGLKEVSTLGDRVAASALMNFAIPLVAVVLVRARSLSRKAALGIPLALLLASELLSQGRGAWLGLLVAMLILVAGLVGSKYRWKIAALLMAGTVVIAGAVAWLNPDVEQRLTTFAHVTQDRSVGQRFIYYRAAVRVVQDHPLVGIGFENFRNSYPHYRGPDDIYFFDGIIPTMVHDGYLEAAVNNGIIGLLLYLALIAAVLLTIYRVLKAQEDPERRDLLVGILAALAAYLVQDLSGWLNLGLVPIFWIMLGLAMNRCGRTKPMAPSPSSKYPVTALSALMVLLSLYLLVNGYARVTADALLFQANSYDVKTQWAETEPLISEALASLPDDSHTEWVSGQLYAKRFVATHALDVYTKSHELLESSYKRDRFDRIPLINIVALEIEALRQGTIAAPSPFARHALDVLTETDGDNPDFFQFKADFYAAQGTYPEALTAIRSARRLAPQEQRYRQIETEYEGQLASHDPNVR